MRKVKVGTVIKAIRKNGLPKSKGSYYGRDSQNKIISACAIGQAAINLRLSAPGLDGALSIVFTPTYLSLRSRIVKLNDDSNRSFKEMADILEEEFSTELNKVIAVGS